MYLCYYSGFGPHRKSATTQNFHPTGRTTNDHNGIQYEPCLHRIVHILGSGEGSQGPDTMADPGRCDFGKGDARSTGNGVVRPRNLSLAKAVTILFCTLEGLRGTGDFSFFVPEGSALTHHLLKQAVVALPLVGHVRSPREIASPAGAAERCHSSVGAAIIIHAAGSAVGVAKCHLTQFTTCLRKPALAALRR